MMELDTNIMQTKTVQTIVEVLIKVERELVMPENKEHIAEIINKHEISMSLLNSYHE